MRATSFFFYESEDETMILSNVGTKIISIGSTVLMPGNNMKISADIAKLPAIEAFVEMGYVSIIGNDVENDGGVAVSDAAPANDAPAEDTTTKRRGRKPASEDTAQE